MEGLLELLNSRKSGVGMSLNGVTSPVKWIEDNLVFPPIISSELIAGDKVGKHIIPFQREVLNQALVNNKDIFIGYSRQISKSSLFAWIVVYLLENKLIQGVCMGPTYGQGDVVFKAIRKQIQFSEDLKDRYKIRADYIENKDSGSMVKKIYNSPSANLGNMAIGFVVVDELCSYTTLAKENLLTILGGLSMSGKSPLKLYATNPPTDALHWSLDYIKAFETDSNMAVFDFSAPKQEDIFSEKTWALANPFIENYLETKNPIYKWTLDYYKSKAELAKDSREAELDFRRQFLGQRVVVEKLKFCEVDRIQVADESIFTDKGIRWALGIDPAWRHNFFSASLVGLNEDTKSLFIKHFLFLANLEKRRKSQRLQFGEWFKQGFIKIFDAPTIPREPVLHAIKNFIQEKNISLEKVVVDPGQSKQWDFEKEWKKIEFVYNSPRNMTGAIRWFEKIIHERKCFFIGKNLSALTQFESAIVNQKSQDYCSINKASEWASVDCVVSSVLAIKHLSETKKRVYNAFYC